MSGLKHILMGMGFMALLVVGSCSMLTYKAVEVAENAAENGGDAIERIEEAADRAAEKRRNEEFYRDASYDSSSNSDYYSE